MERSLEEGLKQSTQLLDCPIESAAEDGLERTAFAKTVAKYLLHVQTEGNFVLGINGQWGSGKTSLANMILEALPQDCIKVKYESWDMPAFHNVQSRILQAMSRAVPNGNNKKLEENLRRFATALHEYSPSIEIALAAIDNTGIHSILFRILLKLALKSNSHNQDLATLKAQLSNELRALKRPIVVVIDNIDRLHSNEVLELIKSIRTNLDLPNTRFLFLYDIDQIEYCLRDQISNPRLYLEKIVNTQLEMPLFTLQQRKRMILDKIKALPISLADDEFDEFRLLELANHVLLVGLEGPRQIKQYFLGVQVTCSNLLADGKLVVDKCDFLVLSYIRYKHPKIYQELIDESLFIRRITETDAGFEDRKSKPRLHRMENLDLDECQVLERAIELLNESAAPSELADRNRRYKSELWSDLYSGFTESRGVVSESNWNQIREGLKVADCTNLNELWRCRIKRDGLFHAIRFRLGELSIEEKITLLTQLSVICENWPNEEVHVRGLFYANDWTLALGNFGALMYDSIDSAAEAERLFQAVVKRSGAPVAGYFLIKILRDRRAMDHTSSQYHFLSGIEVKLCELLTSKVCDQDLSKIPDLVALSNAYQALNETEYRQWFGRILADPERYLEYLDAAIVPELHRLPRREFYVDIDEIEVLRNFDTRSLSEPRKWAVKYLLERCVRKTPKAEAN